MGVMIFFTYILKFAPMSLFLKQLEQVNRH